MLDAAGPGSPGDPVAEGAAGRASGDGMLGDPGPVGPQAAVPARRRAPGDKNRDRAKQRARSS
jgi:hypothetical protein